MKVLVACEFSQIVTKAFRDKGHEAYSCDLLPTEGNPDWHIQGDVLEILDDGWDLMIAHPPCTYLCLSSVCWLYKDRLAQTAKERWVSMKKAARFVKQLLSSDIPKKVIENPIPHRYARNEIGRTYDQIIKPCHFGENCTKQTCLWLENLPKITPTNHVETTRHITKSGKSYDSWWFMTSLISDLEERRRVRSTTFQGIADAMAEQWG